MALKVRFTRVTPVYPEGYYLQWTLDGVNPRVTGHYRFELTRSGSGNGPWETFTPALTDTYSHFDKLDQPAGTTYATNRRPNVFGLNITYYYRLVVTTPDGEIATVIDDTGPVVSPKMATLWRKADRDFRKTLLFTGTPAVVLKRRMWGPRCPKCFDPITKEPLRSACTACYGTGFQKGYWDAVPVHIRRTVAQGASQVTPEQRQDSNDVKLYVPWFPAVDPGDLCVFLNDDRRFLVDQQVETQINLVPVHQTVSVLELARDHIAYRLPIDLTSVYPLL